MRAFLVLYLCLSVNLFAQDANLAMDYFKKGDYEKAVYEYKKLYAQSPSNITYINQIIASQQQLEQYDEAETFINKIISKINYPAFFVELGFNYQLKNDLQNAHIYYEKALESINERPSNVFSIARSFQNHSLLNEAIVAYEKGMGLNPDYNFNIQLAQLYGEQGHIEKMFNSYLNFAEYNPVALSDIKRRINGFLSDSSDDENNAMLRKLLLKKMQQQPNLLWNQMLSWLFIQQKDFTKAFIQEKAIFNRQPISLDRIQELALIATDENKNDVAKEIFNYIVNKAQDLETKLNAHYNLIQIETYESSEKDYILINEKYKKLFEEFGTFSQTLKLQIAYGHFLAFYMGKTNEATKFLEKTLELPLSELLKAQVKLELGDILVLQEKFNQALIYYTQIQRNLKNSTISQEARFRVAKASYYKGDFKWAESQLKILKSSTSQLIANDALDLKLLISDNKYEDSLQTALKLYSKADLLAFQNKKEEAISLLDIILNEHKTEPIVAQALFKQAQLFQQKSQFLMVKTNYENIIANFRDGILADDAYFNLGLLFEKYLEEPEKAKELYEQIIFNHADSIYFVEARKRYRALRGDALN
ncbi:tetratricopeptide repeat protein [Seonamhaeicola aphaedonensis]|uniref:Tetratricopeptide repeat protein n=1 Tax=Seonamhaeicola aphaedonensis TaxID=1461338 RepID=A0A3D9HMG8_9FLAO|nr:tetratricopeptide repeat protein [Seonamhaeicola aphaedonensis]RED50595.1 tetratricopeptide repeat protein [Seonamhaeicola aphaedonensis]